jgi:methylthioribose-1-phosphate isomerase
VEPVRTVRWSESDDAVVIIDQRRLPKHLVEMVLRTHDDVVAAIRSLAVRGAPAIGVTAAMGIVASTARRADGPRNEFDKMLIQVANAISDSRPTAVNLFGAVHRVVNKVLATSGTAREAWAVARAEADAIRNEDEAMCEAIGTHGLEFVADGARVLTHCNAGALATAGIGTALAPVYVAHRNGRKVSVTADETRPLLQGSRLTAWELGRAGIPVRVIADNMAAALMGKGEVDVVLVGADRIAANGDVANKVGTYGLAIAAKHHGIPFVVCAPTSTLDPGSPDGSAIRIEERGPDELRVVGGSMTAPVDVDVWNPAFDVTPAALITAIVTDRGVHRSPYGFAA